MNKGASLVILAVFLFVGLRGESLSAADGQECVASGMTVRNATMLDLWYTQNGGACTIWIHEHLLTVRPGDELGIFSDLGCAKRYCEKNPTYKDYESYDADGDCRVKMLPYCSLADM